MGDNWFESASSWLAAPFRAVMAPWWERLVDSKAEMIAVRSKLLEAVVQFRVMDCQRKTRMDPHRADGITHRVIENLRPSLQDININIVSQPFLRQVEREIEIQAVPLNEWVQLASLFALKQFNPHQSLSLRFTHDDGSKSHMDGIISGVQDALPFTRVLKMQEFNRAELSNEATELLISYCSRNALPEIFYRLANEVSLNMNDEDSIEPSKLPRGWKPTI